MMTEKETDIGALTVAPSIPSMDNLSMRHLPVIQPTLMITEAGLEIVQIAHIDTIDLDPYLNTQAPRIYPYFEEKAQDLQKQYTEGIIEHRFPKPIIPGYPNRTLLKPVFEMAEMVREANASPKSEGRLEEKRDQIRAKVQQPKDPSEMNNLVIDQGFAFSMTRWHASFPDLAHPDIDNLMRAHFSKFSEEELGAIKDGIKLISEYISKGKRLYSRLSREELFAWNSGSTLLYDQFVPWFAIRPNELRSGHRSVPAASLAILGDMHVQRLIKLGLVLNDTSHDFLEGNQVLSPDNMTREYLETLSTQNKLTLLTCLKRIWGPLPVVVKKFS